MKQLTKMIGSLTAKFAVAPVLVCHELSVPKMLDVI